MASLLLAIIYVAFISLGLPDSLLGSAWPVMHTDLGVSTSFAGVISMVIAGGTIVSSLLSDRLTRKLGTGLVTAISVGMTAVALFGFSTASSVWVMILWAVPYGLGAGAVDSALNNYVALHYTARHMSWLHCFWGVGASISPYIMGFCLSHNFGWPSGYRAVSALQVVLTIVLVVSLPLWIKRTVSADGTEEGAVAIGLAEAVKLPGVPAVLLTFFGYCALEMTTGLWASSYLVEYRGVNAETAARFASLFYLGITGGRFVNGFVADKLGDRTLIRVGLSVIAVGVLLVFLPVTAAALVGLVVIGIGCAPVYPSIIHATPNNFGKEYSQAIVGIQMAAAYCGSTFMPPIFGWIAGHLSLGLYPVYLLALAVLMFVMSERLNTIMAKKVKA